MREEVEFRIPEERARRYLPDELGERVGIARIVVLDMSDAQVQEIRRLDLEMETRGGVFFTSWNIRRHYTDKEVSEAHVLRLRINKILEPAGEECGTGYDDSTACPSCGAGAKQITPLFLDGRRLPKRGDFAQTIAGERIWSQRVVDLFKSEGLTGADFAPVRLSNKRGEPSAEWFQPLVRSHSVHLDSRTGFGSNPFDTGKYGRCPLGDTAGLNILTECWISGPTWSGADIAETSQFVGVRRGLLRPERLLLVSPRMRKALQKRQAKGISVEVAHIV